MACAAGAGSRGPGGKCVVGRKGYDDMNPNVIREAKRLARANRRKPARVREIAMGLAALGHTTAASKSFSASQVAIGGVLRTKSLGTLVERTPAVARTREPPPTPSIRERPPALAHAKAGRLFLFSAFPTGQCTAHGTAPVSDAVG